MAAWHCRTVFGWKWTDSVCATRKSLGPHGGSAPLVEGVGEEPGGLADRVGEVDEDHVELVVHRGDRLERVVDPDLDAGVGQGGGRLGVVLAGHLDDVLVQLEEVHLLDRVVLERLRHDEGVTATDDSDPARLGVGAQGGVGQHLVVDVGVDLGQLHDAVEGQDLAGDRVAEQRPGPGSGCGGSRAPRRRRRRRGRARPARAPRSGRGRWTRAVRPGPAGGCRRWSAGRRPAASRGSPPCPRARRR